MFLPNYRPGRSTLEICLELGKLATLQGYSQTQILEPRLRSEASPTSFSGMYGLANFPVHTDLAHWAVPPRYFVLRCIQGDPAVTTSLVDGLTLQTSIGLADLFRALVQPRRPLSGRVSLLRLLEIVEGTHDVLRWDEEFIRPATAAAVETCGRVREFLHKTGARQLCLVRPGDTLVVDNWRVIHGRSSVASATRRKIERAYLEAVN